jgi:hypothetical protein
MSKTEKGKLYTELNSNCFKGVAEDRCDFKEIEAILAKMKADFPINLNRVAPPDLLHVYSEHQDMIKWFRRWLGQ